MKFMDQMHLDIRSTLILEWVLK